MNPTISNDKVLKKFNELPEDLKDALFADEVSSSILEIGKSHGLMLDKVGELSDETGLVMLGITPTSDFIKNLSERLGVAKEKAKAIAEDINQKVFQQVRASLRKVHGLPEGEKVEIKKPASLPPSPYLPADATHQALQAGEVKPVPPVFAKRIVPIDELLDKIDSGESIIKPKTKIENITTPSLKAMEGAAPINLPVETNLSPDEIKSAVEKALGGKITNHETHSMKPETYDQYREQI